MARVEAIPTLCLGHGLCTKIAPEVFGLQFGCVDVKRPVVESDDQDLLDRCRKAVYRCPSKALVIDEG